MFRSSLSFTAELVTFDTSLPYAEVVARLEREVNKDMSREKIGALGSARSRDAVETAVKSITGDGDFMHFKEYHHDVWLNALQEKSHPAIVVYFIGNPLIARTIIEHDFRAALNIPPRLLVLEKEDGTGTKVVYHLPSSVMALSDNPDLKAATQILDRKVEDLVTRITSTDAGTTVVCQN